MTTKEECIRKVSPGGHKTPLEWMAQRSLSDQTIIGLMYTLWDSPTHCKRSCTPIFFFYGPTTLHVPKLFHQSTSSLIANMDYPSPSFSSPSPPICHILNLTTTPQHTSHFPHLTLHTRATRDTMLLSLPSHETSRKKKYILSSSGLWVSAMGWADINLASEDTEREREKQRVGSNKSGNGFAYALQPWGWINNTHYRQIQQLLEYLS